MIARKLMRNDGEAYQKMNGSVLLLRYIQIKGRKGARKVKCSE